MKTKKNEAKKIQAFKRIQKKFNKFKTKKKS